MAAYPPLHITAYWAKLNESIIGLVDLVGDDRFNWSPSPDEWNFRGVFLHIAGSRHHWMQDAVHDGVATPDFIRLGQTREGLKEQLRLSWERQLALIGDEAALQARYRSADPADPLEGDGYWIAFRRLEHDLLHRAQLLRYLEELGVPVGDVDSAAITRF